MCVHDHDSVDVIHSGECPACYADLEAKLAAAEKVLDDEKTEHITEHWALAKKLAAAEELERKLRERIEKQQVQLTTAAENIQLVRDTNQTLILACRLADERLEKADYSAEKQKARLAASEERAEKDRMKARDFMVENETLQQERDTAQAEVARLREVGNTMAEAYIGDVATFNNKPPPQAVVRWRAALADTPGK